MGGDRLAGFPGCEYCVFVYMVVCKLEGRQGGWRSLKYDELQGALDAEGK